MKFGIALKGGLGDLLLGYLMPGSESGYLAELKAAEPSAFVRCAIMSTASNGADFFSECPWFDEIIFADWDGEWRGFRDRALTGYSRIESAVRTWRQPPIFLKADETGFKAPYVVLHPFAGTPNRDWRGKVIDIKRLIDALCDAGLQVVLLGGNSLRRQGRQAPVSTALTEQFDYERSGLTNLINRASVRLQAYLTTRASCFIGTLSSYHCAALAVGIPAFVLTCADLAGFVSTVHPVYGRMSERPHAHFAFLQDLPHDVISQMVGFSRMHA